MKNKGYPGYRRKYQMELIADILGISRIALDRRLRRRGLTSSHDDLVRYVQKLLCFTPRVVTPKFLSKKPYLNNKKQK